jgi:hypothetical protein
MSGYDWPAAGSPAYLHSKPGPGRYPVYIDGEAPEGDVPAVPAKVSFSTSGVYVCTPFYAGLRGQNVCTSINQMENFETHVALQ